MVEFKQLGGTETQLDVQELEQDPVRISIVNQY